MDYTNFTNEYLIMKYGELIDSEDDPHTIYVDVMREEKQVRNEILKRMEKEEKTGRWEEHSYYKNVYICSACDTGGNIVYKDFKYCPNCGAKMKEV